MGVQRWVHFSVSFLKFHNILLFYILPQLPRSLNSSLTLKADQDFWWYLIWIKQTTRFPMQYATFWKTSQIQECCNTMFLIFTLHNMSCYINSVEVICQQCFFGKLGFNAIVHTFINDNLFDVKFHIHELYFKYFIILFSIDEELVLCLVECELK